MLVIAGNKKAIQNIFNRGNATYRILEEPNDYTKIGFYSYNQQS